MAVSQHRVCLVLLLVETITWRIRYVSLRIGRRKHHIHSFGNIFHISSRSFFFRWHNIYTPSKKSWGGGVYRNHPVCPSVCSHRVRSITSYSLVRSEYNFTQLLSMSQGVHDPRVCHDLDPRSYLPRSRSQCTNTGNSCPGHNSSLQSWIWIMFHTIVVHDPSMCHDLDPRSYLQGQGHSAHILEIGVRAITPHCQVGSG